MYAYRRIFRSLAALLILLPVAVLFPVAAAQAATITGTVTNRTIDKPSVGDKVQLVNPVQGMREVAKATTDAQGRFSLSGPEGGGPLLVVVTHDGASYYQAAPEVAAPVNFDVYSAAAHVTGVTTEILMLRAQTDAGGANLNVTEDFVVKNASKPAMTQFSKAPFDLYLPAGAVVEATAAKGPNGMPTSEELTPQPEKGLYSVKFPIRPGETQIEIAYHIPYAGNANLNLKMAGQTDMFAVSLPKSMTFTGASDGQFVPANADLSATTYLVRNVKPGQMVSFAIGGSGQLPRDAQGSGGDQGGQAGAAGGPDAGGAAPVDTAPGKGLGNPLDPNGTREPVSTKYKWWILGGLGLLLVAAAGVLLRKPAVAPVVGAAASQDVVRPAEASAAASSLLLSQGVAGHQAQLLQVLKEELFGLETDRLQGLVSEAEYAQNKAAIELILRRALQRGAVGASAPPVVAVG